jgi:hypothetical protein
MKMKGVNKMVPKNDTKALLDYMDAYKKYNNILDGYFPIQSVIPGQETKYGKTITIEVIDQLEKLAQDVETKRKIWMDFFRKR